MHRYMFPLREGKLELDVEEPLPVWFPDTLAALEGLAALGSNWDSYGAKPIRQAAISAAVDVLASIIGVDTPQPAVVPTNRETILVEWHTRGIDLEVEIVGPNCFLVAFEKVADGTQWESELGSDLTRLVDAVALLS